MKDIFSGYAKDDCWLIKETEWVKGLQGIREAQFTLGNGYMGTRGIYEEIPYDCRPGTFLCGVYDKMASQVSELVNLPNPVNFQFTIEGEKLDAIAMDVLEHKRVLNMKKAVLVRHTVYKDNKGRHYDYQSVRFISQSDRNIGVVQIALTALDSACLADVSTGIDTSVSNAGILSEGRKKHFRIRELGQQRSAGYLVADTFEKKYTIVYWSGFYYKVNGKKIIAHDNIFRLKLKKGQTVIFTKVFCIKRYPRRKEFLSQKKDAFDIFYKAFRSDFSHLIQNHTKVWGKIWDRADILIEGTANIQQNVRFNLYHMLICGCYNQGFSSIGARTLSGEGYRGHIFWDAEIFLLPFYLFMFPKVAKNMLLYRYRCLPESRKLAKSNGYKGAQFAWESADTGAEETPQWARDIDRTIVSIHTHEMEQHITADVAYAVYKYYLVTGDYKFMESCGYEIFIETARFWASRARENKKTGKWEIDRVIGPDEFHVGVDNNAFTNMMAKWNLLIAIKMMVELKRKKKVYERLKNKLEFKEKEVKLWRKVASKMFTSVNKDNIIEQFQGYFKLRKVAVDKTDENGIPFMPPKLKAKDLGKTQLVKQADVLMLLCLLDDVFSPKTKKKNYDFYISKTVHKSSLSAPMHALIACEVGDLQKAYSFFNVSLRADISNLYGNTPEGIHAASLGGTWQALILGFAGVKVKHDNLFINPRMPLSWGKIVFNIFWRGCLVELSAANEEIKVKAVSKKNKNIKLGIFNKLFNLNVNKAYVFKRQVSARKRQQEHY
ncbi:MAG: glycosyl hydrolase family 65 protein [Candidatus Omnitrophota bacterium]|jgi:kojibiose phosphorylase